MSKVKIERFGMIHIIAICQNCSWDGDGLSHHERQEIRNAVHAHVLKTGHTVNIETGTSTKYSLSSPPESE